MSYRIAEQKIVPVRTYANKGNVEKAIEKRLGVKINTGNGHLIRYFIMTHDDGRFFPVFIGTAALQAGIHFHFNVVG